MKRYPGLLGFRDVGGLRTEDGGTIRRGLLYRSGTPQFLDPATARALVADTGIARTIDLRLPHEVAQEGRGPLDGLGIGHVVRPFTIRGLVAATSAVAPMPAADPLVGTYLGYVTADPAGVAAAVSALAEALPDPVLVHCTIGKDRTGVAIALALAAIGVRREDIGADYVAGAADVAPAVARLREMKSYASDVDVYPAEAWVVEAGTIHRFLDRVEDRHGSVRDLLLANGVRAEELAKLRELLVEEGRNPMRVSESLVIGADPDAVWRIGGDTAAIADWVPAIEKSHQVGDLRHATFAGGGGEATERIVEHDDAARSYVYEYVSGPLALRTYRSRFTVAGHPEGAEVRWEAEFAAERAEEEPALADAIGDIYRSALRSLADRLRA